MILTCFIMKKFDFVVNYIDFLQHLKTRIFLWTEISLDADFREIPLGQMGLMVSKELCPFTSKNTFYRDYFVIVCN